MHIFISSFILVKKNERKKTKHLQRKLFSLACAHKILANKLAKIHVISNHQNRSDRCLSYEM